MAAGARSPLGPPGAAGGGGGRGRPCMDSAPIRRLRAPVESPVWGWVAGVGGGLLGGLLALPLLAAAMLLVPCYLLARRLLTRLHLLWHRQKACERVSGTEACWLSAAWGRCVLHAVLVLEGGLDDVARLQDIVATRVLPQCPRLTTRPRHMPLAAGGGMCWVPDADFAIEKHVYQADCGGDGLQVYVSQLLDEQLPEDRPPWELRVLPACGARKTEVVLVVRVHHALADGDALVSLLCHALADNPVARPKQVRRCRRGLLSLLLALLRAAFVGPLSLLAWLALRPRDDNLLLAGSKAPASRTTSSASSRAAAVSVSWSSGIALSKVRRIQQVSRCSLNCVLLSAVGGAVRMLLQGCGVRQPPDLQVALPLSMHRSRGRDPAPQNGFPDGHHHGHHHHLAAEPGSLYAYMDGMVVSSNTHNNNSSKVRDHNKGCPVSNKTAPVVVGLPVSVEGAVPRLWATRRCLQYLRSAADPEVVYMASLGGSWTGRLLAALTDKASIQFATLPGPASTVLVGGGVLKAVYPLQPAPGRLGIAVSVMTYADQVFVTVASDAALGPAGTLLLQHFNVQIELLWRLLRNRRAPGETRPPLSLLRRADVQASPVGELTSRLCYVQGELERLASEEAVDGCFDGGQEAARLSSLKAEFTTLLHEVRKRQLQAARARRLQGKQRPSRRQAEGGAGSSGRRRKRAVSFSLPQRPSLSFGGLLGAGPQGVGVRSASLGGDAGGSDAMLDDGADSPGSSPCHTPTPSAPTSARPSVTISIPEEDEDDAEGGGSADDADEGGIGGRRSWVRASFERAARRSHANLDPQLVEYFHSVQLEASSAYACRCHSSESSHSASPSGTGFGSCSNTSQDDDGSDVGGPARSSRRLRAHAFRMSSSPEQEYDAIAEAYYPAELKNRAKFSLLEESPTAEAGQAVVGEARRPSCLKKTSTRRDTPPSDQSSPSLSTSVLHQLRSYYDESYLSFDEDRGGEDAYRYQDGDLTSPDDLDLDELPPPRERTAAFSVSTARSPPRQPPARAPSGSPVFLEVPGGSPRPPHSFTCKDADQMRYADADDSDSATPSMDLVATALVHSPPARFPRPPMLSVKSSTPCLLSPAEYVDPVVEVASYSSTSTSPRPKFLTQSSTSSGHSYSLSHSASPRGPTPAPGAGGKHRQLSADNGYGEDSGVLSMGNSMGTSHDALSGMSANTDSCASCASGSVSASPRASVSASASPSPRTSATCLAGQSARAFRSLSEEAPAPASLRPPHAHASTAAMATACSSLASSSEHMALLVPLDMSPVRPTTLVIKKTHRS